MADMDRNSGGRDEVGAAVTEANNNPTTSTSNTTTNESPQEEERGMIDDEVNEKVPTAKSSLLSQEGTATTTTTATSSSSIAGSHQNQLPSVSVATTATATTTTTSAAAAAAAARDEQSPIVLTGHSTITGIPSDLAAAEEPTTNDIVSSNLKMAKALRQWEQDLQLKGQVRVKVKVKGTGADSDGTDTTTTTTKTTDEQAQAHARVQAQEPAVPAPFTRAQQTLNQLEDCIREKAQLRVLQVDTDNHQHDDENNMDEDVVTEQDQDQDHPNNNTNNHNNNNSVDPSQQDWEDKARTKLQQFEHTLASTGKVHLTTSTSTNTAAPTTTTSTSTSTARQSTSSEFTVQPGAYNTISASMPDTAATSNLSTNNHSDNPNHENTDSTDQQQQQQQQQLQQQQQPTDSSTSVMNATLVDEEAQEQELRQKIFSQAVPAQVVDPTDPATAAEEAERLRRNSKVVILLVFLVMVLLVIVVAVTLGVVLDDKNSDTNTTNNTTNPQEQEPEQEPLNCSQLDLTCSQLAEFNFKAYCQSTLRTDNETEIADCVVPCKLDLFHALWACIEPCIPPDTYREDLKMAPGQNDCQALAGMDEEWIHRHCYDRGVEYGCADCLLDSPQHCVSNAHKVLAGRYQECMEELCPTTECRLAWTIDCQYDNADDDDAIASKQPLLVGSGNSSAAGNETVFLPENDLNSSISSSTSSSCSHIPLLLPNQQPDNSSSSCNVDLHFSYTITNIGTTLSSEINWASRNYLLSSASVIGNTLIHNNNPPDFIQLHTVLQPQPLDLGPGETATYNETITINRCAEEAGTLEILISATGTCPGDDGASTAAYLVNVTFSS